MTITLSMPELTELHPRITVIGVGGAGGNGVNNMIKANLQGVEFVVANTDAQALAHSRAERRIQLGNKLTQGLGAGARPDVGRAAAEESLDQVMQYLTNSHMVFITAGMGGGTGTGAAPVIARAARELGVLTVGVVTKPFQFEGAKRMRLAEEGIAELQKYVDTLIIIPNQNLFRVANEKTTFADAFAMADEVLHSGVRGITDLMVMPGLVNLDFADVRTVMSEMGKAMMGTGEAEGDNRALEAAEAAISNPLLDEVSMKGAQGVLINITGGMDLTLYEVDEAANRIRNEVDPEANILVGSALDESLTGRMRVSVVATGIDSDSGTLSVQVPAEAPVRGSKPELVAVAPAAARDGFPAAPVVPADYVEQQPDVAVAADLGANDAYAHADVDADAAYEDEAAVEPVPAAARHVEPEAAAYDDRAYEEPAYDERTEPAYPEHRESRSWFDRLTGRGRRAERRAAAQDYYEEERPAVPQLKAQPRVEAPQPASQPAAQQPAAPQPVVSASGRATAEERPGERSGERATSRAKLDDQLEIPTFLRRQAN